MQHIGQIIGSIFFVISILSSNYFPFFYLDNGLWKGSTISEPRPFRVGGAGNVEGAQSLEKKTPETFLTQIASCEAIQPFCFAKAALSRSLQRPHPQIVRRQVRNGGESGYSIEDRQSFWRVAPTLFRADLFFVLRILAQPLVASVYNGVNNSVINKVVKPRDHSSRRNASSFASLSPTSSQEGQQPSKPSDRGQFTNQLIIKYKEKTEAFGNPQSQSQILRLGATAGIRLSYLRNMSGEAHVLTLPSEMPLDEVEEIARTLQQLPEVEYVEPDRRMYHTLMTNDPYLTSNQLWGLNGTWGVNAPAAWDVTTGSRSVVVAVLDTGIVSHSDLNANVLPGYDFISEPCGANDGDGRDADASDPGDWFNNGDCGYGGSNDPSSWHGTHVAGTIAAVGNNALGVVGVAMNTRILPVRVLGKFGGSTSDIADAIRWSAGLPVTEAPINPNPAKVLNLSLGGWGACSATYQRAIDAVVVAGAVVVVAAGNNSSDAANFSPASCNGVITVASTDINGARSWFSNFDSTVEISAPGSGIWSTLNAGATVPAGESYASKSGTSMAAPHVAGVAALILSRYPTLTPVQVSSIIQGSAKPFPSTSWCQMMMIGSGIVNAAEALGGVIPQTVTVSLSPDSMQEDGAGGLIYRLARSNQNNGNLLQPLTVSFSMLGTARYSAQPGDAADYTVTGTGVSFNTACGAGVVSFPSGVETVQVIVSPVADQLFEPTNETVILAISPGSRYIVGTPASASGNINSDETLPTYNGTSINIPSSGTANPYPSTITVSGATGQATRIRVTLYGLSHSYARDIDILLVGPTGAETILMSDVGRDISNVKLTFDSLASASLPENDSITGGTYQPTNVDAPSWGGDPRADFFPTPAPAGPYNTGFTPLLGTNPNGVWSLYVVDDLGGDSGSISGGWSIEIFTDLTVGIYDDTHPNWMYAGSWIRSSGQTGPYNQTINYSSDTSATATIQINGTAFRLRYTRFTNRGTLAVYVDGALVGSVSANGALNWQTVFERRGLSPGVHTVQIRHGGGGSVIDVDAIEVFNHIAGTGIYDDRHSNWVYSGSWSTASQDGPYDRTITFTNDVSAQASIQINGTAFRLRYTRFTNRGRLAIRVDGVQVATQVATGALSWQMVYEQTGLSPGVHTIEIQPVAGAGLIDIDAIEVFPSCLGAGIYDDRHSNWVYSGNWLTESLDGPYNRTITLTNDMSARAAILISGTAFRLRYTRFTNRGSLAIFVDGVQVASQSATGALGWQTVYERTGLSPGDHSIEIRHGGGGSLIDIDAIEVFPSSVRTGIYDDRHSNWVYSGNWVAAASQNGPFSRTITLTNDVSARASILINGTAFRLRYTRSTDRGSLAIFVDGAQVATQSATGSTAWQMVYERSGLSAGDHSIEIRHGGGGDFIDIDAIEVFATTPVAAGIYDDRHSSWVYTGNWVTATQDGPYNRTTTYTNDASARASIQINGAGFRLRYTRFTNRGSLAIYVNGSLFAVQNARGGLAWQTTYERRGLSPGVYTVEIRHGGGAGSFIDIDAIEVFPSTSLGTGVWDDRHPNWVYSGNWLTTSLEGPYNRTLTYTNDLSARASILIFGEGFRLRYTRATNRGSLAIFVDGVQVANHSAAGSMSWQMTFDERAGGLSTGSHTVEIRHGGGGAGSFIDIDAIEVFPSYLSAGIYDERHSNWVYSGNWSTISQTGPYNGTITFTNDLSARVSTVFWGGRFRLRYTRFTNRGSLAIFVDGVQVATQSATGELSWQMVYERSDLNWGFHTVEIRHNGPPGSFIDIDAIQVNY